MDYSNFDSEGYLQLYYDQINEPNKKLMLFLENVTKKIPQKKSLVDIGTGPTIYQQIAFSEKVKKIHCSDYSQPTRQELKKWFHDSSDCFDWKSYFEFQLQLEGHKQNKKNLNEIRNRLRSSLAGIHFCNIFRKPVIPDIEKKSSVVTSFFCPESVSTNQEEFHQSMTNILRILEDDGHLVMGLLKNASYWMAGDQKFISYPVTETELETLLENENAEIRRLKTIEVKEEGDLDGHILVWAQL